MPALLTTTTDVTERNEWRTPPAIFNPLHEWLRFTVDAAASDDNHLLPVYWTAETNGLRSWRFQSVFVNPPYGRGECGYPAWLRHAASQVEDGLCPLAALLVPFDPSTRVWRESVHGKAALVLMLAGRVSFLRSDGTPAVKANFPSAVVVYRQPELLHTAADSTLYRMWDWSAS